MHGAQDDQPLKFDAGRAAAHTCRPHKFLEPVLRQILGKIPTCNMSKKSAASNTPDFEKSLAELEQIVERMEQGELSLDESLKQFERGIALARSCQSALQGAEQKVELLLRKSGAADAEIVPFAADDQQDA